MDQFAPAVEDLHPVPTQVLAFHAEHVVDAVVVGGETRGNVDGVVHVHVGGVPAHTALGVCRLQHVPPRFHHRQNRIQTRGAVQVLRGRPHHVQSRGLAKQLHRVQPRHNPVRSGIDSGRLGHVHRHLVARRAPFAVGDEDRERLGEVGEDRRAGVARRAHKLSRHPRERRVGVVAFRRHLKQLAAAHASVLGRVGFRNPHFDRDLVGARAANVGNGHGERRRLFRGGVRELKARVVHKLRGAPEPLVPFGTGQLHPKARTDLLGGVHLIARGSRHHRHRDLGFSRAAQIVGEHHRVGRRLLRGGVDRGGVGVVQPHGREPRGVGRALGNQRDAFAQANGRRRRGHFCLHCLHEHGDRRLALAAIVHVRHTERGGADGGGEVLDCERFILNQRVRRPDQIRRAVGNQLHLLALAHRLHRHDDGTRRLLNVDLYFRVDRLQAPRGIGHRQNHRVRARAGKRVGGLVFCAGGVVVERPEVLVPQRGGVLKFHVQPVAQHPLRRHVDAHFQLAQLKLEQPEVAVEAVVGGAPRVGRRGHVAVSAAPRAHGLVHRAVFVKTGRAAVHVFVGRAAAEVGRVAQVGAARTHHREPKIPVVGAGLEGVVGRRHPVDAR